MAEHENNLPPFVQLREGDTWEKDETFSNGYRIHSVYRVTRDPSTPDPTFPIVEVGVQVDYDYPGDPHRGSDQELRSLAPGEYHLNKSRYHSFRPAVPIGNYLKLSASHSSIPPLAVVQVGDHWSWGWEPAAHGVLEVTEKGEDYVRLRRVSGDTLGPDPVEDEGTEGGEDLF